MTTGYSLKDKPRTARLPTSAWPTMRTGPKIEERDEKTTTTTTTFSEIFVGRKETREDPMLEKKGGGGGGRRRVVETPEKGEGEGEKVVVVLSNSSSSSSSSQSQSSGYNSSGTPTAGVGGRGAPSAVMKPVTVLRPNRPSADRDLPPGATLTFSGVTVARPEAWRKQGLGSAVPAPRSDGSLPNGDENAFPALPSKPEGFATDSPTKLARPATSGTAPPPHGAGTAPRGAIIATPPVDYSKKLAPIPAMIESVKIIDESFQWRGDDPIVQTRMGALLDSSDFLVVGVVGPQGVGKSTLLSHLAGVKPDKRKKPVFRTERDELIAGGCHQTSGVDMYIASSFGGGGCGGQRLLLLDTQPVFSVSVLDGLIHHDRKYPPDFATAENCVFMQSIHLIAWLLTTCHVVLVVQDWFVDAEFMKAMLTAEMLKPSLSPTTPTSADAKGKDETSSSSSSSSAVSPSNEPTIVFVQTKSPPDDLSPSASTRMRTHLASIFADSTLNIRSPSASKTGKSVTAKDADAKDVNLYILPNISSEGRSTRYPAARAAARAAASAPSDYAQEVRVLKKKLLSLHHRPALFGSGKSGGALGEKTWLRQAGKIWEGIKKASLMLEYNRLLT